MAENEGHVVSIERVEVISGEGTGDPVARASVERLLARWLARAYLRESAQVQEGGGSPISSEVAE